MQNKVSVHVNIERTTRVTLSLVTHKAVEHLCMFYALGIAIFSWQRAVYCILLNKHSLTTP